MKIMKMENCDNWTNKKKQTNIHIENMSFEQTLTQNSKMKEK